MRGPRNDGINVCGESCGEKGDGFFVVDAAGVQVGTLRAVYGRGGCCVSAAHVGRDHFHLRCDGCACMCRKQEGAQVCGGVGVVRTLGNVYKVCRCECGTSS